jgi:ubiquinone/menaquinone biosynthesis C-methylase UbiE
MALKSHEEYVAEEFNRAAQEYDESRLVKSYQRRVQLLVIGKLQIRKGMNVLDLGCGTGKGTIDVAARLDGSGKVIGIDLSQKMIEQAKQNLAETSYNNVEFEVGTASSLDYDNYFDCVFSTNVFHHFQNKEDIFRRIWRSLRHDGTFVIQDICDDYMLMKIVDLAGKLGERAHVGSTTSRRLRDILLLLGFENVEVEKMRLNWFWGIMISKGKKRVA